MEKDKHMAVAGNIGAGKTTLTHSLSKFFGWEAHFENTEANPNLVDFTMTRKIGLSTSKYIS